MNTNYDLEPEVHHYHNEKVIVVPPNSKAFLSEFCDFLEFYEDNLSFENILNALINLAEDGSTASNVLEELEWLREYAKRLDAKIMDRVNSAIDDRLAAEFPAIATEISGAKKKTGKRLRAKKRKRKK